MPTTRSESRRVWLTARAIRRSSSAALALALGAAAACGGESTRTTAPTPTTDFAGVYRLSLADGRDLPVTVFDGDVQPGGDRPTHMKVAVTGGTMTLKSGDRYVVDVRLDVEVDGHRSTDAISDVGTYVASSDDSNGYRLSLTPDDRPLDHAEGRLEGGTIVVSLDLLRTQQPVGFTLRTVNGHSVPGAPVYDGPYHEEYHNKQYQRFVLNVDSAEMTLYPSDSTWLLRLYGSGTGDGKPLTASATRQGTYQPHGNRLSLGTNEAGGMSFEGERPDATTLKLWLRMVPDGAQDEYELHM